MDYLIIAATLFVVGYTVGRYGIAAVSTRIADTWRFLRFWFSKS